MFCVLPGWWIETDSYDHHQITLLSQAHEIWVNKEGRNLAKRVPHFSDGWIREFMKRNDLKAKYARKVEEVSVTRLYIEKMVIPDLAVCPVAGEGVDP